MSKPMVAVVGRPNVGKSTLFNALAGQNIAIVKDTPGVTRDRIYADVEWLGRHFTLIDTGGIEPDSDDEILSQMRMQAELAIETSDVILFMTDVRQGVTDSDQKVADMLRRSRKPVILVVNKVDQIARQQADVYEFYELGIGDPYPISSAGKTGIGELLDAVLEQIPERGGEESEDTRPRIAVVGRPNAGKSSLINRLLGEDRLIVSGQAGTTRDAVDTSVRWHGREYVFIDTAGLRRKSKVRMDLERYSVIRSVAAVERADVVLLLIDAQEGVTDQDARIAGIAHERGKGLIVGINKWDAIEKNDKTINEYRRRIASQLPFAFYAEDLFLSAKTGQRVDKIYAAVDEIIEARRLRVPTGVLNEIVTRAVSMQQPPSDKGKRLKIFYITQVAVQPPSFVLFVNDRELMHFSYTRYLENQIRASFGFKGTPLRFMVRERKE